MSWEKNPKFGSVSVSEESSFDFKPNPKPRPKARAIITKMPTMEIIRINLFFWEGGEFGMGWFCGASYFVCGFI